MISLILNKLCFAQNDSLKIHKMNEIKCDIFNIMDIFDESTVEMQIFYERFLTRRNQSFQLSLAITKKYGFASISGYSLIDEPDIVHSVESNSVAVNYNFIFPNRKKFSSFSIFPLIKYTQFKDNITNISISVSGYNNSSIENRFSIAGGVGIANKWIWMDKISYQIFATGSKSILKAKSKYQIIENRFEPKIGINLGFRF